MNVLGNVMRLADIATAVWGITVDLRARLGAEEFARVHPEAMAQVELARQELEDYVRAHLAGGVAATLPVAMQADCGDGPRAKSYIDGWNSCLAAMAETANQERERRGGGVPDIPPHPEPRVATWSAQERLVLCGYGERCFEAGKAVAGAAQGAEPVVDCGEYGHDIGACGNASCMQQKPAAWRDPHDHSNLYWRKPPTLDVQPLYAGRPPAAEQAEALKDAGVEFFCASQAFQHTVGHPEATAEDERRAEERFEKAHAAMFDAIASAEGEV